MLLTSRTTFRLNVSNFLSTIFAKVENAKKMASWILPYSSGRSLSVLLLITTVSAYIPSQMRKTVPETVHGAGRTQATNSLPRNPTGHFDGQRISKQRASSILTPIDDSDYCFYQFQESEKNIEQKRFCFGPGYSDNRYSNQYPNAGYGYGPGYGSGAWNDGGYGAGYGPYGAGNGWSQQIIQFGASRPIQPHGPDRYNPMTQTLRPSGYRFRNRHKYFGENLREKVELECSFCPDQRYHPNCRYAPTNSLYKG